MKKANRSIPIRIILSVALVFSSIMGGISVSAADTRQSPHTTEDFEGSYLNTFYGGTSNANSYTINEPTGVKFKNYDDLYEQTKAGHHIALPVRETGIGHNGSNSVMALIYDDNYDAGTASFNPGFSVRDNAGNGKSHQPLVGTTYYVSFYYKAVSIPQAVSLYITQAKGSITNFYLSATNIGPGVQPQSSPVKITDISAASEDWVRVSAKYTSIENGSNLLIFMNSSDKTKCKDTRVLIDDIAIDRLDNTIKFDSNGGSDVSDVMGYAGYEFDLPIKPTKENMYFIGWYNDRECNDPSDYICSGDMTLYAKWEDGVEIQGYEGFAVETDERASAAGIHGNGSGVRASDKYAHTGSKSVYLNMNESQQRNRAATILKYVTDNTDIRVEKGRSYKVTFWAYSEEDCQIDFRLATWFTAIGTLANAIGTNLYPEEAYKRVSLSANTWTKITLVAPSVVGTEYKDSLDCLSVTATFDGASTTNSKKVYLDDIYFESCNFMTGDLDGDGSVDATLSSDLKKFLLGISKFDTGLYNSYFDMNDDQATNIIDLVCIKKSLAGQ